MLQPILDKIKQTCQTLFQNNLVGVYVHGSIAFGCFHPERSDIDFLVVVRESLQLETKMEMIRFLLELEAIAPPKGLEMSVVLVDAVRNFAHPCPFDLHYSISHRERALADLETYCRTMNGTDPDLAAHCTVIRAVGFPLCGAEIASVFGEVPPEAYLDSLRYDVENAAEDISLNPVYVILNLCRIAAYMENGTVLSKRDGGEWGMQHLDKTYQPIIASALMAYTHNCEYSPDTMLEQAFAKTMLSRIFDEKVLAIGSSFPYNE